MKNSKSIVKILGIVVVLVMTVVIFPSGALPLGNQALSQTQGTRYLDDDGAESSGVNLDPVWGMRGAAGDLDLNRVPVECGNEPIVDNWTLDSNGAVGSPSIAKNKTFGQSISSISGETVVVRLELRDIPSALTFDRDVVPDNWLEYIWAISIDVDHNSSTGISGRPLKGSDVQIALLNCKFPGEAPHDATIIEGTRHDMWVFDESTGHWKSAHEIAVTVDYASNTITMVASKAWEQLSNLDENSRFCFHTEYYTPDGTYVIDTTAVSQGSGVINDPLGDVPYDFIDITQGSFLLTENAAVTFNMPWGLDADPAAVNIWTYPGDAVAVTLADVEWGMPTGLLIWYYGGPSEGWRFYKKGWGAVNTLETLTPGEGYIGIVPTASVWEIPQG